MAILITGDSGFLGARVYAALRKDSPDTLIIGWSASEFGDFLNPKNQIRVLQNEVIKGVVHLAWHSTSSQEYDLESEHVRWAEQTSDFAKRCIESGRWFAAFGSPVDDSHGSKDASPYTAAKSDLRQRLAEFVASQRLAYVRPHYIFSLEDKRPRLLRDFLNSESPESFSLMHPTVRHDFIHVDDVVSAIQLIVNRRLVGVLDVRSGTTRSNSNFLSKFGYRPKLMESVNDSVFLSQRPEPLWGLGWRPVQTTLVL